MTFWGATRVVRTRTNDRGVEHGCEEDDQEEGRQEEEVIDLRSVSSRVTPEHSLRTYPMNKAKAAASLEGSAAKLFWACPGARPPPSPPYGITEQDHGQEIHQEICKKEQGVRPPGA